MVVLDVVDVVDSVLVMMSWALARLGLSVSRLRRCVKMVKSRGARMVGLLSLLMTVGVGVTSVVLMAAVVVKWEVGCGCGLVALLSLSWLVEALSDVVVGNGVTLSIAGVVELVGTVVVGGRTVLVAESTPDEVVFVVEVTATVSFAEIAVDVVLEALRALVDE